MAAPPGPSQKRECATVKRLVGPNGPWISRRAALQRSVPEPEAARHHRVPLSNELTQTSALVIGVVRNLERDRGVNEELMITGRDASQLEARPPLLPQHPPAGWAHY